MKSKDYEYLREAYSQVYSESGYFPTKESQKADEKKYRMGDTPVKHRTVQTQSKPPVKEDTFDAIKGYLLDEGFADTEQAALAIMANMSEEWRENIVEVLDTPERANEYARKNVRSMIGAFTKGVANKDMSQMKTIKKRGEGAKRAKRKAERKAAEEES